MRDPEIRAELLKRITLEHPDPADNRIRLEMPVGLGASRVDVALVNGQISGWEIKSARDNLGRLPSQVEHYGRCLDLASVVIGGKHSNTIENHVPAWWGILLAEPADVGISLTEIRAGQANPGVDPFHVAQLLWRDEAFAALEDRGLHQGLRKATRWKLWDRLAELPVDEVRNEVRARLKARPHA